MSNPYNHFDHSRDDSWAPEPQEPAAQSYAQYQESLKNPQPQQPAFDPFQQQPQAGAPAPYGQVPGAAPYPAFGMVPANPKSWVGTALLAFFLGHFGAHNFYLGYRNRAIAQLSMTVIGWLTAIFLVGFILLGAVAIWAFVDFVRVLLRSGEYGVDSNGVPLT